jgi:hypothetical protein
MNNNDASPEIKADDVPTPLNFRESKLSRHPIFLEEEKFQDEVSFEALFEKKLTPTGFNKFTHPDLSKYVICLKED